jgi:hypothetical protein
VAHRLHSLKNKLAALLSIIRHQPGISPSPSYRIGRGSYEQQEEWVGVIYRHHQTPEAKWMEYDAIWGLVQRLKARGNEHRACASQELTAVRIPLPPKRLILRIVDDVSKLTVTEKRAGGAVCGRVSADLATMQRCSVKFREALPSELAGSQHQQSSQPSLDLPICRTTG